MHTTAIVIPAYNRPDTLKRLLKSLQAAHYPPQTIVPLVISLDPENGAPNKLVREVAESFSWEYGPKEIIAHPKHLGMLDNFYFCGSLTETYAAVIYMEDDLVVSPDFYRFVGQAHQYYSEDTRIAGVSLYAYQFNGYRHYPFIPLADGADIYFARIMSVLGQSWTKPQWARFIQWRDSHSSVMDESAKPLHDVWQSFADDEYFSVQMKYLLSTNQYYIFPRISQTTGFGDQGVHFDLATSYFQVPIQRNQIDYRFHALDNADAVYDSFMELFPERLRRLAPALTQIDFDVDLNAVKAMRHFTADYVLTTRACKNPIKTFPLFMKPLEANLIFDVEGAGINLCHRSDVLWDKWNEIQTHHRLDRYFANGRRPGIKKALMYFLIDFINRFK